MRFSNFSYHSSKNKTLNWNILNFFNLQFSTTSYTRFRKIILTIEGAQRTKRTPAFEKVLQTFKIILLVPKWLYINHTNIWKVLQEQMFHTYSAIYV